MPAVSGSHLYTRPVHCKYCDVLFDFPTFTTDIQEDGIPVRTMFCGRCIKEMGENEELRAFRSREEEERRRSAAMSSQQAYAVHDASHNPSISSINSTNQQNSPMSDVISQNAGSPEQQLPRSAEEEAGTRQQVRSISEPRNVSNVQKLLN